MSLLGPILFASLLFLPAWFSKMDDTSVKEIIVLDSSHLFIGKIPNTETLKFHFVNDRSFEDIKRNFKNEGYWGAMYIAHIITYSPNAIELYSYSQPGLSMRMHIQQAIEKESEKQKILAHNIENFQQILKSIETHITIRTYTLQDDGGQKESISELATALGYIAGLLVYMFIFLFGTQVMRGVIEEKTNRIIEIVISSIRPIELMAGKITGIALVGLTQFSIWVALTVVFSTLAQKSLFPELSQSPTETIVSHDIMNESDNNSLNQEIKQIEMDNKRLIQLRSAFESLQFINFTAILLSFVFYFICGYLLYGGLFAAIGAVSDAETDSQQFMLPVTIPLVLAILVMINTIQNPDSSLSVWFSIIPFTSPVVMMARIPFGVPWYQVLISASILILTIILITSFAAKIYRTGILMYGKKTTYRELWKWFQYKG